MGTNPRGKYKGGKLKYKSRACMTINTEVLKKARQLPDVIVRGLSEVVEAFLAKKVRAEINLTKEQNDTRKVCI